MAIDDHILCASGFGNDIDGTYTILRIDKYVLASSNYPWTNGTYYLNHDDFWWMICDSDTMFDAVNSKFPLITGHLMAKKAYVRGSSPAGHYTGVDGNPSGDVVIGSCP